MATPTKNLISATGVSLMPLYKMPLGIVAKHNMSMINIQNMAGNIMFYNQLHKKFFFKMGASVAAQPTSQGHFRYQALSSTALIMIANTFPAAYTKTSLRPIFGQIWPRSGFLPPF